MVASKMVASDSSNFADFEQAKIIVILLTLNKPKLLLICWLWTSQNYCYFADFEQAKIVNCYFVDFEQVKIFSSCFADFEQVKIRSSHFADFE